MDNQLIPRDEGPKLLHFDMARRALQEARSVDEVKAIRDQAQAVQAYLKQQRESLDMQNDAGEIKLRAERRLGEMLRDTEKNPGTRGNFGGRDASGSHIVLAPESAPPKLADMGITKIQSHRWQREALVPEADFEAYIYQCREAQEEVTSTGLIELADRHIERVVTEAVAAQGDNGVFLRLKFARYRMQLHALLEIDPAEIAGLHDAGDRASVRAIGKRAAEWFAAYEAAIARGIRGVV